MIDAILKDLDQKPVVIKGTPQATPSRAFALWLALLVLYFLLIPTAAETPDVGADTAARDVPATSFQAVHPHDVSAARR